MSETDGENVAKRNEGPGRKPAEKPRESSGKSRKRSGGSREPSGKETSSRFGDAFFAVQKFIVGRAWSLLLLVLIGEIGGFLIHKNWESVSQASGRNIVQVVLLVLGLIAFWIAPGRAGFMRRLCFLLVFAGGVLVALTWGVEVLDGRALKIGHLEAVQTTWLGELGLMWLMFGVFLALLMYGGRFVFSKWRETPDAAARRAGKRSQGDDSPRG